MHLDSLQPFEACAGRRKQALVIEALTALAQKLGPGAKLPTARELAKTLKVNGLTLTRSLEQLETRGVLRCRQGSGIYVEDGVTQKRVALVFGENIFSPTGSHFGSLLLQQCVQRAGIGRERFSFYLDAPALNGPALPAHRDLVESLEAKKLDGIILVARSSVEQETWLRAQGIPVVSTEARRKAILPGATIVSFDYSKLIESGVQKLVDSGCQKIGLLGVLREHADMFRKTLRRFDLSHNEGWIVTPSHGNSSLAETHKEMGADFAELLLRNSNYSAKNAENFPDGLLITDDILADGAMRMLAEQNVLLGSRLKICSHANTGSSLLAPWAHQISTVEFNPHDMAEGAFLMLEALMNGNPCKSPRWIAPVSS